MPPLAYISRNKHSIETIEALYELTAATAEFLADEESESKQLYLWSANAAFLNEKDRDGR